jgi:hypothetical protein
VISTSQGARTLILSSQEYSLRKNLNIELQLLKDLSEFTFDNPAKDKRPTILVKLKTPVLPLCGQPQCNGQNCARDGKFPDNSYERTIF